MTEQNADVRALLEHVAKALVDSPDQVQVNQVDEEQEISSEGLGFRGPTSAMPRSNRSMRS